MPLTEQDILAAREARRPPEAGILQTLFDALYPAPTGGMPTIPLMPGTLGYSPASTRLGMLSRFKALRESPLWETMPREQQLQALRGQPSQRSPELQRTINDMMRVRSDEPVRGLHSLHREPARLGWLQELLKGGQKP